MEKFSASMTEKETTGDVSTPVEDSVQETTCSPAETSTPIGDGEELEKNENTKLEGVKDEARREGIPS